MIAHVVIGANYGDEGKGSIVQRLSSMSKFGEPTLVVMTNGGAQRGHTIVSETGERYVNKHFHSGWLDGADCLFASSFILNPMEFAVEYNRNKSVMSSPNMREPVFYRDEKCYWTTPWDMIANQAISNLNGNHNSCGMGIWETKSRGYRSISGGTLNEFCAMPYDRQIDWLEFIRKSKLDRLEPYLDKLSKNFKKLFTDAEMIKGLEDHFINDCKFMLEHTINVDLDEDMYQEIIGNKIECWFTSMKYKHIIFENGQGLAIGEQNTGDVNTQTPSHTGLFGALPGYFPDWLKKHATEINVHYVSRTYLTRHGDGEMDNFCERQTLSSYIEEDKTNQFNQFQGGLKYGALDCMALQARILNDLENGPDAIRDSIKTVLDFTHCDERGPDGLIVTGMDQINYYGGVR